MDNTYDNDKLLPITVYKDGSYREEDKVEYASWEKFMESIDKQIGNIKESLVTAISTDDLEGLKEHFNSLTNLKDMMEEIWREENEEDLDN